MPTQATAADAELILKLYDLRREAEMRKARHWWTAAFWPQTAEEVLKITSNMGGQENNWFRQVSGYWSMAASLGGARRPESRPFPGAEFFWRDVSDIRKGEAVS